MERLTIPDKPIEGGVRRAMIDARAVRAEAMTIYWRLKAYEDTGLKPEEIMDDKLLTGWIPVADRLPTQNMEVYASIECRNGVKEVRAAYYRDGDFVNDQGYSLHKIIKAWQPRWIPMPYDPQD